MGRNCHLFPGYPLEIINSMNRFFQISQRPSKDNWKMIFWCSEPLRQYCICCRSPVYTHSCQNIWSRSSICRHTMPIWYLRLVVSSWWVLVLLYRELFCWNSVQQHDQWPHGLQLLLWFTRWVCIWFKAPWLTNWNLFVGFSRTPYRYGNSHVRRMFIGQFCGLEWD